MNPKFYLFVIVIVFSSTTVNSQRLLSCDSLKNTFLLNGQVDSIYGLVDTVFRDGNIYFKRDSNTNFALLLQPLNIDSNITFIIKDKYINYDDSSVVTILYQQYYKGIEVNGGGYTESYIQPGGPTDLCLVPYAVSPYLLSGINLDPQEALFVSEVADYLNIKAIDSSALEIELNQYFDCGYNLTYKLKYYDIDSNIVSAIVDAVSGDTIRRINDFDAEIPAVTRDFGTKNMKDSPIDENQVWLVSDNEDSDVYTYDYEFVSWQGGLSTEVSKGTEPSFGHIPTLDENASIWPSGAETVYQTHWIANEMIALWKTEFSQIFKEAHFMSHLILPNAFSKSTNNLDKSIFIIGDYTRGTNEYTFAWPGVIAHELTHAILHDKHLDYDGSGIQGEDWSYPNGSLHEGIADIFGVYLRSVMLNEEIIWLSSAHEHGYGDPYNFKEPAHDCYTDIQNYTDFSSHDRADPLRHWFYLCVNGDESLDIPAINAHTVLSIILKSIPKISPKSDYIDLMHETLNTTLEIYGRCSDEFLSLARAWEGICVPTGYTNPNSNEIGECGFKLIGPATVYEESNYLFAYLQNAITTHNYVWTLIGRKNTEYESTYGMQGNGQYGDLSIELTQFPTHIYYPQKVTIKVSCAALGGQYTQKHTVLLLDGDHDDPTCDDYYDTYSVSHGNPLEYDENPIDHLPSESESIQNIEGQIDQGSFIEVVQIHNVLGQLLYKGYINDLELSTYFANNQFVIVSYYDKHGRMVYSPQKIIFSNK